MGLIVSVLSSRTLGGKKGPPSPTVSSRVRGMVFCIHSKQYVLSINAGVWMGHDVVLHPVLLSPVSCPIYPTEAL